MIAVIIAGGAGTRLWPLSTNSYPKHLLQLTNEKSLLQNTISRAANLTGLDKVIVIPEASHARYVQRQLPEIHRKNILVEPARRGTASCVLLALTEIKKRGLENEPIVLLWADHLILDEEGFAATISKAGNVAESQKRLVFVGVKPTYPSTGFGYMERDGAIKDWPGAFKLQSFKEKPAKKIAETYYKSGRFFWNTGYLVGTLETFERTMQETSVRLWEDYLKLYQSRNKKRTYLGLLNEPLEIALSEKITDGIVVPGNFDWVDVGSFKDLHGISLQDENGNHVRGKNMELESTTNSYIRNESNLPLAVIGLDNIIVVSTENGILVTNRNFAQKVGEVSKRLQK